MVAMPELPAAPVAVGLVGAGPWADALHAPMLAAGPETTLAGVWARRPEAARALASAHGTRAVRRYEELLDACEAVAFAVPPDVQAAMAVVAARAGRHLLLEKPVGLTVEEAQRVADAVDSSGVVSQLVLTNRYTQAGRDFLARAAGFEAVGAHCLALSGALLGDSPFATPWRRKHGALLDVGPHALDMLEAALGPVRELSGRGDPLRWTSLTCRHAGGAVSAVSLSISLPLPRSVWELALYGPSGSLELRKPTDPRTVEAERAATVATIRREFAAAVRAGEPPPLDARRGLELQRLIDAAARSLG